ncbi:MAG: multi-sensor signal transduction histidine kinase [Acidobacteria bacterium]|nr:multi-sensor signal transduction histidine kinase [Acidobacteriota bacterium]
MNRTVLIVDDSLTVRMDLADAFRAAGFDARPCGTVAAARAALSADVPSVFILDVLLPDGDGVDLLQEIRRSPSGSAAIVVMLSSEAEVKDRIRGLQTGADEYVGKPYDVVYLVAKVQELLQERQVSTSGTTILVIDDSATFRNVLGTAFESAGHRVVMAASGEEGLRLASASRPDAIVVDGELPGIDGPAVIRHIRLDAALRDVPCLLLTASGAQGAELRALDAGADTFVRKEEDLGIILAKLAAVLRRTTARASTDEDTKSLLGPKKILAVDDSAPYLQELTDALRGEGYDLVLARSGEEAIELLAVQPVDCILLAHVMPGLGGHETCRRIKAAPIVRDIPLIMLTMLENRDATIQGLAAGADDCISKESEFDVLKARVRAQIRRKQFEDENRRVREGVLHKELEAAAAHAARELAETRAALIEELEAKNKELDAFSYSVSHDLRAPLRHVIGFAALLAQSSAGQLGEQQQRYVKTIGEAAARMGQLIDDLLAFSKLGGAEMATRSIDLGAVLHAAHREVTTTGEQKDIVWRIGTLPTVEGDPNLLRLAFVNLLSNAVKYSSTQERPEIEVGVAAADDRRQVVVFVRDNGVGFDMAYAHKLFGVFQRLHTHEEFEGTGIGLANVRRIVARHGGRVWAEGVRNEGATFYVSLPLPTKTGETLE